jgi:hypothetical protein
VNDELVEKVARAINSVSADTQHWTWIEAEAKAAIRVVVEECAGEAEKWESAFAAAAAIRNLAQEDKP